MRIASLSTVFALAILLYPVVSLESLFAQTDFYQGKTVTLIVSTAPGGTGDLRGRPASAAVD